MYPNQPQQNLGFYVPPSQFAPMQGQMAYSFDQGSSNQGGISDMLNNLLHSKPNFNTDVFERSDVYQSKYT
jgi:hypothetical protein